MKGDGNTLSDYQVSYTRAELEAIRSWLAGVARADAGLGTENRGLKIDEKIYLAKALDRLDAILTARFGVPAAAAPATLLSAVSRPGEETLAVARLAFALAARGGDAAFALEAQEALLAILASRPADAADAALLFTVIRAATVGTASEAAALTGLASALRAPYGAALYEVAQEELAETFESIAEGAEKEFPGLNQALQDSGVRDGEKSLRDELKLRHYRELSASIAAASSKVKKPTAAQTAAAERAARLLPLMEKAAASAGVLPGDTPGEIAAELLNEPLQKGYQVFPGVLFNTHLRALGVMDAGTGISLSDHRKTYTRADVVKLRDWLSATLASGQGWESDGTTRRALTDAEKKAVEGALAAAERALSAFDAAPKSARAFAPLALAALPALGLAPWLIFAALGLGAAYIVWKLWPSITGAEETEAIARETVPGSIIARHRRIELVARRMATAVNGGNFRSRFIGPGGTDFAEARPYQGEDMREIDWKTSAKKDELYA
ncbi:MAG: DUF58 domain-containing protein, partial [Elusimicrobia bacterium]|nr:DUF58 domain-containing protein [Elusimicrobiota bacterium]